ncbi:hypothetical protein HYE67_002371 [Fusarium culmorum]|uniref:Extracellular membrane protein CFEM domain-containing protein n=1 Tax=Fusarium culmorum TaxID=5516 RepID=A0A7S8D1D5_FUSCU|nr:hypothetical protein HYE67_002371 [Fusarium culmorum]
MKFITSLVILSAATVSAKPAGNKECTGIYQRCLETITPDECPKGDRDCLCQAWDDMMPGALSQYAAILVFKRK